LKIRLDAILVARHIAATLESARTMIRAGEIFVDEKLSDKPGTLISSDALIRAKEKCPYVSRGGYKLARGLGFFQIDVTGFTCIDVGASTGGFTDCLLQNGADHVFAVDVAYGQLAWKIRQDPRVTVIERFNARNISLNDIGGVPPDIIVMDASFISITKILPALSNLFTDNISILTLIKPQFELPRTDIGPGGVVVDESLHKKAIQIIEDFVANAGWASKGVTESPIKGPKGNTEFLMHIVSADPR